MKSPKTQEKHKAAKKKGKSRERGKIQEVNIHSFNGSLRRKEQQKIEREETRDIIEKFSELRENTNLQIERAHQYQAG